MKTHHLRSFTLSPNRAQPTLLPILTITSTPLVFTIPELLENILLQIPERDLLLSQRVNETFRDVIKHSPQLERKLFFTADIYQEGDLLRAIKWNPLLDAFHPYRPSDAFMWRRDAYKPWEKWRNLNQNNQLSREDFVRLPTPSPRSMFFQSLIQPSRRMYALQTSNSKFWERPIILQRHGRRCISRSLRSAR